MGSNPAKTVYIYFFVVVVVVVNVVVVVVVVVVMSTHTTKFEYCSFSECVAIVAIMFFSSDRKGTLDFRFDMLFL